MKLSSLSKIKMPKIPWLKEYLLYCAYIGIVALLIGVSISTAMTIGIASGVIWTAFALSAVVTPFALSAYLFPDIYKEQRDTFDKIYRKIHGFAWFTKQFGLRKLIKYEKFRKEGHEFNWSAVFTEDELKFLEAKGLIEIDAENHKVYPTHL